jgi:signal peptidase I
MADFRKSTLREYFESIVIAVILALFIRTFVVQAFKIPTGSMEENLLIGDHLLVNKFIFGPSESRLERALLPLGTIKRHDVLVFKYPEEPDRDFIKRVIGLPGDHIKIAYGHVYVNDEQLAEPYVPSDYLDARSYSDIVVPNNSYFVLGDHRSMSNDSRDFGPVMRSYIYGKAVFGYWPMEKLGILH